jgi:hypothetical protein
MTIIPCTLLLKNGTITPSTPAYIFQINANGKMGNPLSQGKKRERERETKRLSLCSLPLGFPRADFQAPRTGFPGSQNRISRLPEPEFQAETRIPCRFG